MSITSERKRKQRERDTVELERKVRKLDTLFMFGDTPVSTLVDVNNKIWFRAIDIATALEYGNPSATIYYGIQAEEIVKYKDIILMVEYDDINPETIFFKESTLYVFLMRCNMPKAEAFVRWVTEDVLPSIREHNRYEIEEENNPLCAINVSLQRQLNEYKARLKDEMAHHAAETKRYKEQFQQRTVELQEEIDGYKAKVESQANKVEHYQLENAVEAERHKTELAHRQAEINRCREEIERHEAAIRDLTARQQVDAAELEQVRHQRDVYRAHARDQRMNTLMSIRPNYVPRLENERKRGKLILINKHTEAYPYYAARIQSRNYAKRMKDLKDKYPSMTEILNVDTPNGVCLFNYLFEKIPWLEREVIRRQATNSFKALENKTEEEMLRAVRNVLDNPISY